jgi:putative NIF3 family GTP cyclohydrolase 1 type 2
VGLDEPVTLQQAIERIKGHLCLSQVRVSSPNPELVVSSLAVCPGAGGSLLERVQDADLFLTGEMRHHDVLARRAQGAAVILTDHTNSERAFLPRFAERLRAGCPGLDVSVSRVDADPLQIV